VSVRTPPSPIARTFAGQHREGAEAVGLCRRPGESEALRHQARRITHRIRALVQRPSPFARRAAAAVGA